MAKVRTVTFLPFSCHACPFLIDEDITAVDLGIGVLYIKRADLEGNIIKYRFEPSPALDKAIKDTIINKQNLLEDMILTNLKEKFDTAYKNLC